MTKKDEIYKDISNDKGFIKEKESLNTIFQNIDDNH